MQLVNQKVVYVCSFLKLIPSSPTYMPKEDSKQKAIESIEMFFPLADRVSFKQSSTPHFVDPGINLERSDG